MKKTGFIDDHSLRRVQSVGSDNTEQEADRLAQEALIPPDIWKEGDILEKPNAYGCTEHGVGGSGPSGDNCRSRSL